MTCIILSGGMSRRAGGRDKAFFTLDGETFIERKIRQLSPHFDEIIITVRDSAPYSHLPARIIEDESPGEGPLMGLYSGLKASSSDISFVTTVDAPFTSTALALQLIEGIGDYDAHVPRYREFTEPLFATYRKSCLSPIRKAFPRKRVTSFYPQIRIKWAEEELLRRHDPELDSFININSREEYRNIITGRQRKKLS